MPTPIEHRLAEELACKISQVSAAIALLDEGATVPFIARYRKEVTGGLDDTQLRLLDERLVYLRELEDRRVAILAAIDEQGKLTPELAAAIADADNKQRLEDLYLPYKQKRRTKAQIAREAGLDGLADALLADPTLIPEEVAAGFLNADAGFADAKAALDGARQIIMERLAEDAELLGVLRERLRENGVVRSTLVAGKETEGAKFRDYFDYSEALGDIPSHRALALFRGRNEGALQVSLLPEAEPARDAETPAPAISAGDARMLGLIAAHAGIGDSLGAAGRAADRWLAESVRWAWRIKIQPHLELELMGELRERAEEEAIRVFAHNLRDLLLAAPAGRQPTMGLDPGIRTGVKVAVVDATGKLLDTATVYPHEPRRDVEGALTTLAALVKKHAVSLIAIGNGTASRETDQLAAELIRRLPERTLTKVVVSEAGASVYSASEFAAREFPDLDVSLRGAVSIARRLQDPLAELVKIDPKSIGVGQYQHDVSQTKLSRALDAVVEDGVNAVGVDANTASVPLLARVSGLTPALAANIVAHRDAHGAFTSRRQLREVPRLGDKTFEQAAGFLRIVGGEEALDASAVHPEAYPLVERILAEVKKDVRELIGDTRLLRALPPERFADERFGVPTVKDILQELEKPGRDPRPEFKAAHFREGVEAIADLTPGMLLEGVVTNVANFGAFVDIGVHQDGLVHISALSKNYVKDPRSVVKAGDVVKVKVLEIDAARKRIALTMRLDDDVAHAGGEKRGNERQASAGRPRPDGRNAPSGDRGKAANERRSPAGAPGGKAPAMDGAMAAAFARLKR
ncbi:S1 RNA-binding domain-containing protein [Rhodocyclus tenuis]|uniref:Tex family protein n=1 Tax=Rhodocyclus gracilis TaxID=2929842 RepID=UPI001298999C|nr:Tex family protein [Rhodocyclus gracilis]MRD72004.1 S1 RNA-binding domain-containing protein [Rhodocyclus gracilis]